MSESFGEAMLRLQTQAGIASEHLQEVSQAILDMATGEEMSRDTHFAGFAQMLMQEIDEQVGAVVEWGVENDIDSEATIGRELAFRWRKVIARRAYDLVSHTLNHIDIRDLDGSTHEEQIATIPNMTAWPEETKE